MATKTGLVAVTTRHKVAADGVSQEPSWASDAMPSVVGRHRPGPVLRKPGPPVEIRRSSPPSPHQHCSPLRQDAGGLVTGLIRELAVAQRGKAEAESALGMLLQFQSPPPGHSSKSSAAAAPPGPARGKPAIDPRTRQVVPPASTKQTRQQQQQQQPSRKQRSQGILGQCNELNSQAVASRLEAVEDLLHSLTAQLHAGTGSPGRQHRAPSPSSAGAGGCTAVVVASPRKAGDSGHDVTLAALFEGAAAPGDGESVDELEQQLTLLRRQNLKLASRLRKTEEALADRSVEVRRWKQAVEAQAGSIAELRVDAEQERRHKQQLLDSLASDRRAAEEQEADQQGLQRRLGAAEGAAAAAEGEAASLRCQLAAAESEAAQRAAGVAELQGELNALVARLQASELVRREAEAEREAAALEARQLGSALADVRDYAEQQVQAAQDAAAAAQAALALERQRSEGLAAQLRATEGAAAETERLLREQLAAVQQERSACLAAATRADALLVKLGSHALRVKGDGKE